RNVTYNPTTQDSNDPTGSQVFRANTGVDATALVSASDMSVDNAEMDTLPPIFGSEIEGLTIAQIQAGELDYANYRAYYVDYRDLSLGHILYSAGKIGE